MDSDGWAIASSIASMVTALAVILAILSFVGDRQQRHREFENMYVRRYWDIQDRMSCRYRLGQRVFLLRSDKANLLDYLRLCEDELEIRSLGLVTHNTWEMWSEAIILGAGAPHCSVLIADEARRDGLKFLRLFLATGEDPYQGSRLWSRINGL